MEELEKINALVDRNMEEVLLTQDLKVSVGFEPRTYTVKRIRHSIRMPEDLRVTKVAAVAFDPYVRDPRLFIGTSDCCHGHLLEYRIGTNVLELERIIRPDLNVFDIIPGETTLIVGFGCDGKGVRAVKDGAIETLLTGEDLPKVSGHMVFSRSDGEREGVFLRQLHHGSYQTGLEDQPYGTIVREVVHTDLTDHLKDAGIDPDMVKENIKRYKRTNSVDLHLANGLVYKKRLARLFEREVF